jgi:iron complex outermembrane receptor protein
VPSTPVKNIPAGFPAVAASLLLVTLLIFTGPLAAQTVVPATPLGALKKLSLDELMDIEVTSVSKRPERLLEAAAAIQVITGEDIRRSGASNIPEALRLANSLDVAQENAHEWAISTRGFSSDVGNKLLVLVDGRTVYTPLFSGVFWDRQDYLLEDIDRIEVISGPGGALWGANAVNGVINISTKSAKDTQGTYLEAGGGTSLRGFAGVRQGGWLTPKVAYRVYAKYADRDGEILATGNDAPDAWSMGQLGFRIDADPSTQNSLTLQGDFYRNDAGLATGGEARASGGNILGRWTRSFASGSDISLQAYYDRTHLILPTPPVVFAPAGILRDDLDTYDLDFQHRLGPGRLGRFSWGLGYRFTHDLVGNSPGLAFFPAELDQHLFSGFAQHEMTLREDLVFTLGTKVEHNDYTGLEVEPSGRLQWNISPRQALWAAVSRAVRAPARIDRDISQPAPGFLIVILQGGSSFTSETVAAYELGYRAQLGAKATVSLSTFYNDYGDLRSTSISPPDPVFNLPFPFFFENNLEGETHGFELNLNYQVLDRWRLQAGYNFLEEDLRIKPGRMDFNNALNETDDAGQQFSLQSSMILSDRVELHAGYRWVATRHVNNAGAPATIPSYAELDVRLGWRPTDRLEVSLVGRNLLHDQHLEYGRPGATRTEIRRHVYGKITWRY